MVETIGSLIERIGNRTKAPLTKRFKNIMSNVQNERIFITTLLT
jgi:hypothetical protein